MEDSVGGYADGIESPPICINTTINNCNDIGGEGTSPISPASGGIDDTESISPVPNGVLQQTTESCGSPQILNHHLVAASQPGLSNPFDAAAFSLFSSPLFRAFPAQLDIFGMQMDQLQQQQGRHSATASEGQKF